MEKDKNTHSKSNDYYKMYAYPNYPSPYTIPNHYMGVKGGGFKP